MLSAMNLKAPAEIGHVCNTCKIPRNGIFLSLRVSALIVKVMAVPAKDKKEYAVKF